MFDQWCKWYHQSSDWGILHAFLNYSPIIGVDMRSYFSNEASTKKGNWWNFTSSFICYPILLDDVIDVMIFLVNTDAIFTLYDVDIEEIYFAPSWKIPLNRISNYFISISNQKRFCISMRISYPSTTRKFSYVCKSTRRQCDHMNL